MKKTQANLRAVAALAVAFALAACSDDPAESGGSLPSNFGQYVISAATSGSSSANYVLTAASLDEGEITTEGDGVETSSGTTWVFWKDKYLYRLQYNQGNAGTTTSFCRDATGTVVQRPNEYTIPNRFTTYGIYGGDIITAASIDVSAEEGATATTKKGLALTYLDVEAETTNSGTVLDAENFLGTGEYVTFSGILESGGKLYTAVVPLGFSAYGLEKHGDLNEHPELVATENSGTGSHGATAGEITGTQHPDEAWVAIYEGGDFSRTPVLIKSDKISYACGRMRSQYYQTVWAADNGDIYVFSPSYAQMENNPAQHTDLPSGVVRIKAGETRFDDFYVNLEALSGGLPLYTCWHLTGNYFLLQFYTQGRNIYGKNTNRLAVFNADDCSLKTVTGLPSEEVISSFGKTPYSENGFGYISVVTNEDGAKPAIWRIDPATATKGLVVDKASSISAVGVLK